MFVGQSVQAKVAIGMDSRVRDNIQLGEMGQILRLDEYDKMGLCALVQFDCCDHDDPTWVDADEIRRVK